MVPAASSKKTGLRYTCQYQELCVSMAERGKLDIVAGGRPKIWGEEDVQAEPGGERFVQKGVLC